MKTLLLAASLALAAGLSASAALAQQGGPPSQAQIAAAQALFGQIEPACSAGTSGSKACGVLVYSPEDCSGKKDGHVRQVYGAYPDHTVRFQQANTGIARQRPMALIQPFSIIEKSGRSTKFAEPQFVSLSAYDGGQRSVKVCGQDFYVDSQEFKLPEELKKFLKANP